MKQNISNEVAIQIPNSQEDDFFEEKSDVHILLIILVILSIPIVMGRIRSASFPVDTKIKNFTLEDSFDSLEVKIGNQTKLNWMDILLKDKLMVK